MVTVGGGQTISYSFGKRGVEIKSFSANAMKMLLVDPGAQKTEITNSINIVIGTSLVVGPDYWVEFANSAVQQKTGYMGGFV